MKKAALVLAGLAMLGLAACGDDSSGGGGGDLTAEEQEYVDGMMASLNADET